MDPKISQAYNKTFLKEKIFDSPVLFLNKGISKKMFPEYTSILVIFRESASVILNASETGVQLRNIIP